MSNWLEEFWVWLNANDNIELFALTVTLFLGFTGTVVGIFFNYFHRRFEARMAFTSKQLSDLYGPLYALVSANTAAFEAFKDSFGGGNKRYQYDPANPWSEEEEALWKVWADEVFIPSNLKIRDVIVNNAHLMIDGKMPEKFEHILAHIESSKLVLSSEVNTGLTIDQRIEMLRSFKDWPHDFNDFVDDCYTQVSEEHDRQIGHVRRSWFNRKKKKPKL